MKIQSIKNQVGSEQIIPEYSKSPLIAEAKVSPLIVFGSASALSQRNKDSHLLCLLNNGGKEQKPEVHFWMTVLY